MQIHYSTVRRELQGFSKALRVIPTILLSRCVVRGRRYCIMLCSVVLFCLSDAPLHAKPPPILLRRRFSFWHCTSTFSREMQHTACFAFNRLRDIICKYRCSTVGGGHGTAPSSNALRRLQSNHMYAKEQLPLCVLLPRRCCLLRRS